MNIKLLPLFFVLFSMSIYAQNNSTIKKWGFGAEVFPNSTFEILQNDGTANTDLESNIRNREIAKFCLSGQVYASYKLNSRMSVSSGLGYQNTGNQTKEETPTWITTDTAFDPALPTTVKFIYNHHNIQIPVFYNYNITNRFYTRGGISTIINFSNKITSIYGDNSGNNTRNTFKDVSLPRTFRTLNFTGNIGFGYTFFQSSLFSLYAQTNIETTLLQLKKGAHLNRRPVSIGLIFGARI